MTLKEDDRRRIVQSYETFNGNAYEAAKELPFAKLTIKKIWKNWGLNINKTRRKNLNNFKKGECENIIQSYETFNGNAYEAEKELPYEFSLIKSIWKEEGLPLRYNKKHLKNYNSYSDEQIYQILEAYEDHRGLVKKTFMDLHFIKSKPLILRVWRDHGLINPTKQKGIKIGEKIYGVILPLEEIIDIIRAYETFNGSPSKAEKNLNHRRYTISKIWKNAGLKKDKKGRATVPYDIYSKLRAKYI